MDIDLLFEYRKQALGDEPLPPIEKNKMCCQCSSKNMGFNMDHDFVCYDCGIVDILEGRIDEGADWNACVTDTMTFDGSRVGMAPNPLYNDWGNGSKIGNTRGFKVEVRRMAKIDSNLSSNHKDRSLHASYTDIQSACERIGITESIADDAKCLYRKIEGKGITRGAVRVGMKACCVYYACKRMNVPRDHEEIASAFGIVKKDISRVYKKFIEFLGEEKTREKVTLPADTVPRIISATIPDTLKGTEVQNIVRLARRIQENPDFMGKASRGVAGACILYSVKNIDINRLCKETGVSKITLTKYMKSIEEVESVNMWTDGSCLGNPGEGGWAAVIKADKETFEISGGTKHTTNNRMELEAAVNALRWLNQNRPNKRAIIHTDSNYVKTGMTKWIAKWIEKDFKDVKNDDLWRMILKETNPNVVWRWVRAHAGNPENERADALARQEAIKQKDC